jgi:hypothetical protein
MQKLTSTLSGIGLQSDVSVSRAGQPPKITTDEALIHVIRMPGDLDPSLSPSAVEIQKILSVLLSEEDYSTVVKSGLTLISTSGGGKMKFQELDLAKVRGKKGLAYLDLFEFHCNRRNRSDTS